MYLVVSFDNDNYNEPELLYSGSVFDTAKDKARFYAMQEFHTFQNDNQEIKDFVHFVELENDEGYEVYEEGYWSTQYRIIEVKGV